MRSKSEVIIADLMLTHKIDYIYEKPLTLSGITRYPDFTIEDAESGLMVYWEHCGLLHDPGYRARWEAKKVWYATHGILPHEEGGGENGVLVVTRDTAQGGISSLEIERTIKTVFSI